MGRIRPLRPSARGVFAALAAVVALSGCGGGEASAGPAAAGADGAAVDPGAEMAVRRAPFERWVLLTGELSASRAIELIVPRTPSWQVDLRSMAADGAEVAPGEVVVELDNSSFAGDLEDKEISLAEAIDEYERQRLESEAQAREKQLTVAQREAELAKAEIDAAVPAELVTAERRAELELEVAKARAGLVKATEELATHERTSAADLEVKRLEIAKQRREIETARRAIEALTLRAPSAGVFLVAEHPWHGRKIQVGDSVYVGLTVGRIPDLGSLVVEARLPDVDDGTIAPGMPVRVVLDPYPDREYRGRVADVTAVAQEENPESLRRFFRVVVELDEIDAERMIPGMSARVEVLAESRPEALVVPRRAIDWAADLAAPRVRLAGGGAEPVRLGPCDDLVCVVEEGLEEGARLAAARAARQGAGGSS